MGVEAPLVYGDWFAAGKLSSVSYKLFVLRSHVEDSAHGTPAVPPGGTPLSGQFGLDKVGSDDIAETAQRVLLRAEAALLQEHQLACVSGRDLYTFSLDGSVSAPDPPEAFRRTLAAVSTGTFLTPFAAENENRYITLLSALENLCRVQLLRQGSDQFLPFDRGVLSVFDGSVIKIEPSLLSDGNVRLRITATRSQLQPLSAVAANPSPTVWILPSGKPCVLVGAGTSTSYDPPSPTLARAFYLYIKDIEPSIVSLERLEESPWVQVSCDGRVVMWPMALVVAGPPPESTLQASMARHDPYEELEHELAPKLPSNPIAPTEPTVETATKLHHTINPPPAPPPSPLPRRRSIADVEHMYPTPMYNSYNSPPGPMRTPAEADGGAVSHPGDEDSWGVDENVTNADFNYFDAPFQSPDPAFASNFGTGLSTGFTGMRLDPVLENDSEIISDSKISDTKPKPTFRPTEELESKAKVVTVSTGEEATAAGARAKLLAETAQNSGVFSPVLLDTTMLDSKYVEGGRFHYTAEDQKRDDGAPSCSDDESMNEDGLDDVSDEGDNMELLNHAILDLMDVEAAAEADWDDISDGRLAECQWCPTDDDLRRLTHSWHLVLTSTPPQPVAGVPISTESMQLLMAQIVWDSGSLRQLTTAPFLTTEVVPGDSVIRKSLMSVFPQLRPLSVSDIADSVKPDLLGSQLGPNTPSLTPTRADTPLGPAMSSQPRSRQGSVAGTTKDRVSRRERDEFVHLSSPLYNFMRNGIPHKARASALSFWRLLDLHPVGKPRDIVLIVMSLASPSVQNHVRASLESLQDLYSASGLGTLTLPTLGDGSVVCKGMFKIQADARHASSESVGEVYEIACAQLKKILLSAYAVGTEVAVVMAYPETSTFSSSFVSLARGYQAVRAGLPEARWLLLSLDSFLSPWDSDVILTQREMERVALLLYDRWVQRTNLRPGTDSSGNSATMVSDNTPAFSLANLVSQSINLSYTPAPLEHVLEEDPVMHVSYSISLDRRWVSVAWTDQWAKLTRIEVMRLSAHTSRTRMGSPIPMMDDALGPPSGTSASGLPSLGEQSLFGVLSDIWQRTGQLCASVGAQNWQIVVLKSGHMDLTEFATWQRLVRSPPKSIKLIDVCLFYLPHPRGLHVRSQTADIFSHEKMQETGNGSSGRDDWIVVNMEGETHGLAFTTKTSSVGLAPPAQATGILVKPVGGYNHFDDCPGYNLLEISMIYHQNHSVPSRLITNVVIGQFRRLASFAETTGVTTGPTLLPWHANAVTKMSAFLANALFN